MKKFVKVQNVITIFHHLCFKVAEERVSLYYVNSSMKQISINFLTNVCLTNINEKYLKIHIFCDCYKHGAQNTIDSITKTVSQN